MDARIKKHVETLARAGQSGDPEAFIAALASIRADPSLSAKHKGALVQIIAQEQAAFLYTILTGTPPPQFAAKK